MGKFVLVFTFENDTKNFAKCEFKMVNSQCNKILVVVDFCITPAVIMRKSTIISPLVNRFNQSYLINFPSAEDFVTKFASCMSINKMC